MQFIMGGYWNFNNFTHYSLSTFTDTEIRDMFSEGCELLHSIVRDVVPDYQICAFRAGGWAIQPFDKIKQAFIDSHIYVDSSCAKGVFSNNSYSSFDFRNLPSSEPYRLTDDVLCENQDGLIYEIPISTYKRHLAIKVIDGVFRRLFPKYMSVSTDGTHHRKADVNTGIDKKDSLHMCTFSRISWPIMLMRLIGKRSLVVFIDHPKDFTQSSLTNIKFISLFYNSISYFDFARNH